MREAVQNQPKTISVVIIEATSGDVLTGVVAGEITLNYVKAGQATPTLKTITGSNFREVDATDMPGVYQIDFTAEELDTIGEFSFTIQEASSTNGTIGQVNALLTVQKPFATDESGFFAGTVRVGESRPLTVRLFDYNGSPLTGLGRGDVQVNLIKDGKTVVKDTAYNQWEELTGPEDDPGTYRFWIDSNDTDFVGEIRVSVQPRGDWTVQEAPSLINGAVFTDIWFADASNGFVTATAPQSFLSSSTPIMGITVDGGDSWIGTDPFFGANSDVLYAVDGVSATDVHAVGGDGDWLHFDGGDVTSTFDWSSNVSGKAIDLYDVSAFDATNVWVCGASGNIEFWDGTSHVDEEISTANGYGSDVTTVFHAIHAVDVSNIWAVGEDGEVWLTTAGSGGNFTSQSSTIESSAGLEDITDYDFHGVWFDSTNTHGWIVGNRVEQDDGIILRTADGGTTWSPVYRASERLTGISPMTDLGFSKAGGDQAYYGVVTGRKGLLLETNKDTGEWDQVRSGTRQDFSAAHTPNGDDFWASAGDWKMRYDQNIFVDNFPTSNSKHIFYRAGQVEDHQFMPVSLVLETHDPTRRDFDEVYVRELQVDQNFSFMAQIHDENGPVRWLEEDEYTVSMITSSDGSSTSVGTSEGFMDLDEQHVYFEENIEGNWAALYAVNVSSQIPSSIGGFSLLIEPIRGRAPSWHDVRPFQDADLVDVWAADDGTVILVGEAPDGRNVIMSEDKGENWETDTNGIESIIGASGNNFIPSAVDGAVIDTSFGLDVSVCIIGQNAVDTPEAYIYEGSSPVLGAWTQIDFVGSSSFDRPSDLLILRDQNPVSTDEATRYAVTRSGQIYSSVSTGDFTEDFDTVPLAETPNDGADLLTITGQIKPVPEEEVGNRDGYSYIFAASSDGHVFFYTDDTYERSIDINLRSVGWGIITSRVGTVAQGPTGTPGDLNADSFVASTSAIGPDGDVYVWLLTGAGVIFYTEDTGKTWNNVHTGIDRRMTSIQALDHKNMVASTKGFEAPADIFRSSDGGRTWKRSAVTPTATGETAESIYFLDERRGFVVGGDELVYRYQDNPQFFPKNYRFDVQPERVLVSDLDPILVDLDDIKGPGFAPADHGLSVQTVPDPIENTIEFDQNTEYTLTFKITADKVPVTGVEPGDAEVFVVKNGTYASTTIAQSLTEVDAANAPGLYTITIPASHTDQIGDLVIVVKSAFAAFGPETPVAQETGAPTNESITDVWTDGQQTVWAVSETNVFGGFIIPPDTESTIRRSEDSGETWVEELGGQVGQGGYYAIEGDVGQDLLAVGIGTDDGFGNISEFFAYKTPYDAPATTGWDAAPGESGVKVQGVAIAPNNGDMWFCSGGDFPSDGRIKSVDATVSPPTFTTEYSTASGSLYDIAAIDDQNIVAVGGDGDGIAIIVYSTDGGSTWTRLEALGGVDLPSGSGTLREVEFLDANNGWAVGGQGTVLKTSDGGQTWSQVMTDANGDENFTGVQVVDSSRVFISGFTVTFGEFGQEFTPKLYKSEDGGVTHTELTVPSGLNGLFRIHGSQTEFWVGADQTGVVYFGPGGGAFDDTALRANVIDPLEPKIDRLLGLNQENYRMFNQQYDPSFNKLTSATVRLYPTKADADADTNHFAEYQISITLDAQGRPADYRMTRGS